MPTPMPLPAAQPARPRTRPPRRGGRALGRRVGDGSGAGADRRGFRGRPRSSTRSNCGSSAASAARPAASRGARTLWRARRNAGRPRPRRGDRRWSSAGGATNARLFRSPPRSAAATGFRSTSCARLRLILRLMRRKRMHGAIRPRSSRQSAARSLARWRRNERQHLLSPDPAARRGYAARAVASASLPTARPSSNPRRAGSSGTARLRAGSPRRTTA